MPLSVCIAVSIQLLNGQPMVNRRKRFEVEECLKLEQVFPPGLSPVTVLRPALNRDLQLVRNEMKQRSKRQLGHAEHDAGKAQVAKLHGKAKLVGSATPLPNGRKIGLTQGVTPDQLIPVVGQGKQTLPLSGREDRATGHDGPS
jgi:hypothetical protein